MRQVTLDIETIGEIINGDLSSLDITVVGVHDSETNSYQSFTVEELWKLWPILERADMLIGYNLDHFDIPILNKYYPGDLTKIRSLDILKEIRQVLGRRLKLNNVAEATLGKKKTGTGLEAIELWAKGEIKKVRDYCLNDVRLTREIYDYARAHDSLKYRDFDGMREIPLETSGWERLPGDNRALLTHTLPF